MSSQTLHYPSARHLSQLYAGREDNLSAAERLLAVKIITREDWITFEGLAPLIAREIWRIVREIRGSGIATVIVDKNYAHVTALTDRNVVLVKGQVAYDCDSATARADPAALHAYLGV